MKKHPTPQAAQPVSRSTIAKDYNVNGGTVTAWVKGGCPQLPNGKMMRAKVEQWLQDRAAKKEEARTLRDEKLLKEIDRIAEQIRGAKLDNAKKEGKLHDSSECARSLAAGAMAMSRKLNSLPAAFRTAFPEVSKPMLDWLGKWVDDAGGEVKNGGMFRYNE